MRVDELLRDVIDPYGGRKGETYLRCDSGSLHFVQKISHFLQIGEVGTFRVQSTRRTRPFREWINDYFSSTAGMNLEVECAGYRVLPKLTRRQKPMSIEKTIFSDEMRTIGSVFRLDSSQGGSSSNGSSNPSDSIPRPVDNAWAGAIHTYG